MVKKLHRIEHYFAAIPKIENASTQLQLLGKVRATLPQDLRYQCLGATLDKMRLILYVSSSAWAGRLRFYYVVVQTALAKSGVKFSHMDVKVLPPPAIRRETARPLAISSVTANLLRETAACIHDPDLAAALCRLADHGRSKKS